MKAVLPFYFSSFLAIWLSSILKRWSVLINRFETALRGDLPDYLTVLFRALTHLIDIPVITTWVAIAAFIFYRKQWKIESYFMAGNLA